MPFIISDCLLLLFGGEGLLLLFCLVLSCLVLSCLVLSCLVLFCFVLSSEKRPVPAPVASCKYHKASLANDFKEHISNVLKGTFLCSSS